MASVSEVFVHIGPLKTGTTYIQAVLYQNRAALSEHGVVLPRATFGQHVRSVLDLMGRRMHHDSGGREGQWQTLVDEVASADAHAGVISMEFLCTASAKVVRQLVDSLAPAQVHVVWTARDLTKVLPAAWQTLLRNKQAPTWSGYLDSVREAAGTGGPSRGPGRLLRGRGADDTWGHRFWRQQDPRQALAPYLEHVPAERVHVVTVPPSGSPPELLWQRFSAAVGLDAGVYDIDVPRANISLGGVECEVLRRVNARVSGRIPGSAYNDLVKFFVAREVLERRTQSFPLVLPEHEREWVAGQAADAAAFLSGGGFVLHGDLADLTSAAPSGGGGVRQPDDVSDAELLTVTQETLADVLLEMARRQGLQGFAGPRSTEVPLPPPADLGLSGEPPSPGDRQQPLPRDAPEPASVTALREALEAGGGTSVGDDPDEPPRPRRRKGRPGAARGGRGGQGRGRGRSSRSA